LPRPTASTTSWNPKPCIASGGALRIGPPRGTVQNELAQSAQKKAPGKAVSQGGRGQQPFPGAIGRLGKRYGSVPGVCPLDAAAPRCIRSEPPASMPTESASWSAGTSLAAPSPVRTHPHGLFFRFRDRGRWGLHRLISRTRRPFRPIVRRENREITIPGQGRFPGRFSPDLRPASGLPAATSDTSATRCATADCQHSPGLPGPCRAKKKAARSGRPLGELFA
jgi:hypothetical protein